MMKSLCIIVLVGFIFVMPGCNSQGSFEIKEESKISQTKTPDGNSVTSPASSLANSDTDSELTIDKFNQIKTGMTYEEVKIILGKEASTSNIIRGGENKIESYHWKGRNFKLISVVFMKGKVFKKVKANLF